MEFPIRYLPKRLTRNDRASQIKMLLKSKKLYKKINIIRENTCHLLKIRNLIIF